MPFTNIKDTLSEAAKESDLSKVVAMIITAMRQAVKIMEDDKEQTGEKMETLYKLIVGNGDPTNSMLAQIDRIEKSTECNNGEITDIKRLLVGDVKSPGSPSMLDRLRKLESAMATTMKVVWTVLAVVIGQIVLRFMDLL